MLHVSTWIHIVFKIITKEKNGKGHIIYVKFLSIDHDILYCLRVRIYAVKA